MARGGGAQGCKGSGTEPAGGDMRILTIRIPVRARRWTVGRGRMVTACLTASERVILVLSLTRGLCLPSAEGCGSSTLSQN